MPSGVTLFQECRLGQIHLFGQRLHPLVSLMLSHQADRSRIAAKGAIGKCVDNINRDRHFNLRSQLTTDIAFIYPERYFAGSSPDMSNPTTTPPEMTEYAGGFGTYIRLVPPG